MPADSSSTSAVARSRAPATPVMRQGGSRWPAVELITLAIARAPSLPDKLPARLDAFRVAVADLNQQKRAVFPALALGALGEDTRVIIQDRALRFAQSKAFHAAHAVRHVSLEGFRDGTVALAVVDPGKDQSHGETPHEGDPGCPEGRPAMHGPLALQDQPEPGKGQRESDDERCCGEPCREPGLEPRETSRKEIRNPGHHGDPAE